VKKVDQRFSLVIFAVVVLAAAAGGGQFVGGDWYPDMRQPSWNPSAWLMTIAWAAYFVLMAVSGWLVWLDHQARARVALAWWLFQLLLGIAWSAAFFGLHRIGWSIALMTLWVLASLVVTNAFRLLKTQAALLMAPVSGWLVFCWVLNFVQWHMNGGGSG
jgi:benzodiazapine receptor